LSNTQALFRKMVGRGTCCDFGTPLKITQQQQIDSHVGVGLSSAAVDHLSGIGYLLRIQAISR
jgi:hypothetical protein